LVKDDSGFSKGVVKLSENEFVYIFENDNLIPYLAKALGTTIHEVAHGISQVNSEVFSSSLKSNNVNG